MQSFLKKYTNGVFIIAEIGVNHNGDIDLAKKLIDVSKETKADAVKFQTFNTDKLVKKDAPKAEYQKENTKDDSSQYDMIKKLELSKKDFLELKKYAEEKDIMFMSTPFDLESVDILDEIGVEIFKVGSGDCDNFILLHKIIQTGKPIIISTGMANFEEIKKIKEFMDMNNYQNKYIFLHCLSSYPAPYDQMNMSCIQLLREQLKIDVGFSDHTTDDTAAIMSIAYGAVCVEKHITLDNDMDGPDHKASLNPENFKRFVDNVRRAEIMIGDGKKRCMPCEENTKQVARKNLVFTKDMKKGEIIGLDDIEALRPNIGGVSPMHYFNFIGKEIKIDVERGDFVLFDAC
jgi:N,N'-diacetyllegionaminate synthase